MDRGWERLGRGQGRRWGRWPVGVVQRRSAWWLVPAGVIVAGTLGANRDTVAVAEQDPVTLRAAAGAVPAAVALLVALRAPRGAVALNGLAVGGYLAAGLADGPILLSVPLVAYVAARQARPRALLPWLGAATGAVAGGLLLRAVLHGAPAWTAFWQGIGLGAGAFAAALLGWWLAGRREVGAERSRRAGAEEQLRMAQDLHDGVGHGLAVIAMQAGVALHLLDRMPHPGRGPDGGPDPDAEALRQVRRSLDLIRGASTDALDALRTELARMAPGPPGPGSGARPPVQAPRRGLADLDGLLERVRSAGTRVDLVNRGDRQHLSGPGPEVEAAAFAIVQESLTNMLRHADADRATVELDLDGGSLVVTVTDDGAGPGGGEPAGAAADGSPGEDGTARERVAGQGIAGMRARAQRLGGSLEAGPRSGGGWRVRAVLPVQDALGTQLAEAQAEPESKAHTQTESKAHTQAEPKTQTGPEPKAHTQAEPKTQTGPEPKVESEADDG